MLMNNVKCSGNNVLGKKNLNFENSSFVYQLRARSLHVHVQENLKLRACCPIVRSIGLSLGLRFSHKNQMFEVNKSFIIWLFA